MRLQVLLHLQAAEQRAVRVRSLLCWQLGYLYVQWQSCGALEELDALPKLACVGAFRLAVVRAVHAVQESL